MNNNILQNGVEATLLSSAYWKLWINFFNFWERREVYLMMWQSIKQSYHFYYKTGFPDYLTKKINTPYVINKRKYRPKVGTKYNEWILTEYIINCSSKPFKIWKLSTYYYLLPTYYKMVRQQNIHFQLLNNLDLLNVKQNKDNPIHGI